MKNVLPIFLFFVIVGATAADDKTIVLPESCNTPDAMEMLPSGDIILSVPNFTDDSSPGVLMKIAPDDTVSLFCRLPLHPKTKKVFPMGIRRAPNGDLYVADLQGLKIPAGGSRLLRVVVRNGKPLRTEVVATGFNVANGVAIHDGYVYMTDSCTNGSKNPVESGVYRIKLGTTGLKIGENDPHLIATLKTYNKEVPVGADGLTFDDKGNLYVANCGDGVLEKFTLNSDGKVTSQRAFAKAPFMKSTDGIYFNPKDRKIYVADILANAVQVVSLDGKVKTIAQSEDNDGSGGQLDGPCEAIIRGNEIIVSNFDRVFPGAVNTKPDKPYTLSKVLLEKSK